MKRILFKWFKKKDKGEAVEFGEYLNRSGAYSAGNNAYGPHIWYIPGKDRSFTTDELYVQWKIEQRIGRPVTVKIIRQRLN